jgi:hypothetical protein
MASWIVTQPFLRSLNQATEISNFTLNRPWITFELAKFTRLKEPTPSSNQPHAVHSAAFARHPISRLSWIPVVFSRVLRISPPID